MVSWCEAGSPRRPPMWAADDVPMDGRRAALVPTVEVEPDGDWTVPLPAGPAHDVAASVATSSGSAGAGPVLRDSAPSARIGRFRRTVEDCDAVAFPQENVIGAWFGGPSLAARTAASGSRAIRRSSWTVRR